MGPLKLTPISDKVKVNESILKGYLGFLIEQGLVEERTILKSTVLAVTQLGKNVLRYFGKLTYELPFI